MVTIRDVARLSGVHVSTVSRAFSAPHLVNVQTRGRVLAAAAELGYRPNPAARGLITGRTQNIGLIVADVANPFFPPLIKAAEAQARAREHSVFIVDTNEDPVVEEELVRALAKQVDGVVLCSPRMGDRLVRRAAQVVPLVVVNRRVRGLPVVLMDVAGGTRQAVGHLAGLGHRHVVLVSGPVGSWTSAQMRRAAVSAAAGWGVRLEVVGPNVPTPAGGAAVAEAVVASGATAVVAYNDVMALGLVARVRELGVSVPGGLSVVGVDDTLHAVLAHPRLTSVSMPSAAAGRAAVDLLLQVVSGGEVSAPQTVLDTGLVVRESTAPPVGVG